MSAACIHRRPYANIQAMMSCFPSIDLSTVLAARSASGAFAYGIGPLAEESRDI
jgi:hypothetical protein